jgi:hypothetical protein
MKNLITLSILGLSTMAFASPTVTSAPLVKAPFDTKKALFIDKDGGRGCEDPYELYVRAVKPDAKSKEAKDQPQGDFDSFYFAKSANPTQSAIIVSRPGQQEYIPACLAVK